MDTKKLRQKILDLAIRGKLVPQDPNDEPASVLLERIRTEKERLIKEGKIKRSKKTASDDEIEAPFEIPESWEWCMVEDFTYDLQYGTSEKSSAEGEVPVLRMGNITRVGTVDFSDLVYSSNKDDINKYALIKDDLLFNRTNSSEWVGKTAIFKSDSPAIYAGYLIRVRCILVCPDFINFVLNSSYHRDWCNQVKTDAVNQSNINAQKLSKHLIPIPPYKEQLRIANVVERWVTLIDELESNEGDLLKAIDKAKSKILDLAIHGKLVPQDPNDEPAIELLKRINPKFEPCDNVNDLPKKWIQATLGDIGKWKSGGTPDRKIKSYYNNGQIPWLKIADIQDGYVKTAEEFITQEGLDNSSANINPVGSIALAMYGSIGKVGILTFPAATNQAICVCSDYVIEQKYLFYFLLSQRSGFYMMAGGGVQANISKQIIVKYPISIPPYNEQLRIVAKIKELFAVLNSIKKSLE